NSLPTSSAGGPLQDLGTIWVVALPPFSLPIPLTALTNLNDAFYEQQAGIVSVQLTQQQASLASSCRIGILDWTGNTILLAENETATYVRADDVVFRISPQSPDNKARTTLYATFFGAPATGAKITVQHAAAPGQMYQGPPGAPPIGAPQSAITFPSSVTTDSSGRAELLLTASSPGNPRGYIDGQVYSVVYEWAAEAPAEPNVPLSIRVWDEYVAPDYPTWIDDVQPIFQQYANLYPAMTDILDLSNYLSVVGQRHALIRVLELPIEDPNYMPVTRDLSPTKQAMILRWLGEKEPPLFVLNNLTDLRRLLQLAIEVEHATIPPYLCALFSIKPQSNIEVARLIRSVVIEEMLHMALACNILNAVGGSPQIAKPGFIPQYPGNLPGGLGPGLTISLRRCTKEHIRDVFMAIEEPARLVASEITPPTIDMRGIDIDGTGNIIGATHDIIEQLEHAYTRVEYEPFTVGWFYHHIARAIVELERTGTDVFVGDPMLQLTQSSWPGAPGRLYKVTDKASALFAIHDIIKQGEGAPLPDSLSNRDELSHYFRFGEIVAGRQMMRNSAGEWVYEGPPIPFDPDGVFPMEDNPDSSALDPYSPAVVGAALFEQTYSGLLRALHRVVNGHPDRFGDSIGLMYSLRLLAQNLMTIPTYPGSPTTTGPSFRFL
ncbi:MAG: ferritin-like protein, partial [Chloroflexia bacterium]